MGDFLRYTTVASANCPRGDGGDRIATQLAYAVMAAVNDELLRSGVGTSAVKLANVLEEVGQRGVVERDQARGALTKLDRLGFTQRAGRDLIILPKLRGVLENHARAVLEFHVGARPPVPTFDQPFDYVRFNSEVFKAFFYGDFGTTWRTLRREINAEIRRHAPEPDAVEKETNIYLRDALSVTPRLWAVVNIVAAFGPFNGHQICGAIHEFGLLEMAPLIEDVSSAIAFLQERHVLEGDPGCPVYFDAELQSQVEAFVQATCKGMLALQTISVRWASSNLLAPAS
jgi:hypothetical protein